MATYKSKNKQWGPGEDPSTDVDTSSPPITCPPTPSCQLVTDLRSFIDKAQDAVNEANKTGDQVTVAKFDVLIHSAHELMNKLSNADASVTAKVY